MALIGFRRQFAPDVENGTKRQTIRAKRKRPILQGETLHLYVGLRTKSARKLLDAVCTEECAIHISDDHDVCVGCRYLTEPEKDALANADGFTGPSAFVSMMDFFEKIHGLPFWGQLIK